MAEDAIGVENQRLGKENLIEFALPLYEGWQRMVMLPIKIVGAGWSVESRTSHKSPITKGKEAIYPLFF